MIAPESPFARLQWKGTTYCMDIECECGEGYRFHGSMISYIKCKECGAVYRIDPHITLHKVSEEPDCVNKLTKKEHGWKR